MRGYITPYRLGRILDVPISLPQTELRTNKTIEIAAIPLALGQRMTVQSLTVTVVRILTPGQVAELNNVALGICSVHWLFGFMLTGGLACAATSTVGSSTANLFSRATAGTPGVYRFIVSNNTNNLDLSVVVTGSAKIYM